MGKSQALESYLAVFCIAAVAQSIGLYEPLARSGLSASFWGITIGIALRYFGMTPSPKMLSGEFFVKIGVTLMAVDVGSIVAIGLPGLVVAWLDTSIVIVCGVLFATRCLNMDLKDSIVVAGATSICGSSAATAISSAIHSSTLVDPACRAVIAIMGVLNTPLMPLMPLVRTLGNVNPKVVGAWIGGSVDSTGPVVASASLGGGAVLETATIVKMAQNVIIGPFCLLLTVYFQKSFQAQILLDKFPLFVVGFFVTSAAVSAIKYAGVDENTCELAISNSWHMSEWSNLVGFALIGLSIDLANFRSGQDRKVLIAYLFIQGLDLVTTFGWAYLIFRNASYTSDDDDI